MFYKLKWHDTAFYFSWKEDLSGETLAPQLSEMWRMWKDSCSGSTCRGWLVVLRNSGDFSTHKETLRCHNDCHWRLIDYLWFYVPLKNISLMWRRHHAGEGLQNLGLCSALRAFEQGGSFPCHTCCDTGAQVFPSHLKDFSYDTQGNIEDLF